MWGVLGKVDRDDYTVKFSAEVNESNVTADSAISFDTVKMMVE